jgi:hypothetical protein
MVAEFAAGANLKPDTVNFASASRTSLETRQQPGSIKLPGR